MGLLWACYGPAAMGLLLSCYVGRKGLYVGPDGCGDGYGPPYWLYVSGHGAVMGLYGAIWGCIGAIWGCMGLYELCMYGAVLGLYGPAILEPCRGPLFLLGWSFC